MPALPRLGFSLFEPDGFPLSVMRLEPQRDEAPHEHTFDELVVITAGTGRHDAGGEQMPLQAGDVFVLPAPGQHAYTQTRGLCLINVLYDPGMLRLPLEDLATVPGYHALFTLEPAWRKRHGFRSRLHLGPVDLSRVLDIIERLEKTLRQREPGFAFLAKALFMQLIALLAGHYSDHRQPDAQALIRIAQAISHLERHPDQPVRLADLAAIAAMSQRSFLRAFTQATGHAPIDYLLQLRLRHAARLLRTTDQSITEIAFAVGFGDSNYFARQFRGRMGCSPSDYRRSG